MTVGDAVRVHFVDDATGRPTVLRGFLAGLTDQHLQVVEGWENICHDVPWASVTKVQLLT